MTEEQMKLLLDSFGLENLLVQNDVEQTVVLDWLVKEGYINPDDYWYTDEDVGMED